MELTPIFNVLVKQYGFPVAFIFSGVCYLSWKQINIYWKKRNGTYVSFKSVGDISKKLEKHIVDTNERFREYERDMKDVFIVIEKAESKIETLRIVSGENMNFIKDMIKEIREDIRSLRGQK